MTNVYEVVPSNPSNGIKLSRLHTEIEQGVTQSIEQLRLERSSDGQVIFVKLNTTDSIDVGSLQSIIDNHDASENTDKHYRLYEYMEGNGFTYTDAPYNINYNILGLKKERIFVGGELSEVKYWGDYNPETKTYSDLIVREHRVYHKDENGYNTHREMRIYWYTNDDTESDPKTTYKYYSPLEATSAGERRRSYVIDDVKIKTVGLIVQTESLTIPLAEAKGLVFMDKYTIETQQYRDGDRSKLIDAITNHDIILHTEDSWLDNFVPGTGDTITIRQYLVSELTY